MKKNFLLGWIIRVIVGDEVQYATDAYNQRSELTTDINRAKKFQNFELLITVFNRLKENNKNINDIKISKFYINYDDIDITEGLYNHELQKSAIKKLNLTDVEALGLEQIAAFSKLDDKKLTGLEDFYPEEKDDIIS